MVTLETEIDEAEADQQVLPPPVDTDFISPRSPPRRSRTPRVVDSNLLSPPVNTWKSRPRHRPTRSQSAPPERRTPAPDVHEDEKGPESTTFNHEALGFVPRSPTRSFTAFTIDRQTTRGGELVRPPPPLRKCVLHLPLTPLFKLFAQTSSADNILAKNTSIRGHWRIIFSSIPSHPTFHLYCRRSRI